MNAPPLHVLLVLLASALPTALWLWVFLRRDRDPEPRRLLARTFAYGMLAWAVAAAWQGGLGLTEPGLTVHIGLLAVLAVALIEEGTKLIAAGTAYREPTFDHHLDGLMYAVTAALGFALLENVSYGLTYGAGAALQHGLLTTLAHALFSAPLGYGLARARFGEGRGWRLKGLLLATGLHAAFNGLLRDEGSPLLAGALGVTLALMVILGGRYYRKLERWQREELRGG